MNQVTLQGDAGTTVDSVRGLRCKLSFEGVTRPGGDIPRSRVMARAVRSAIWSSATTVKLLAYGMLVTVSQLLPLSLPRSP